VADTNVAFATSLNRGPGKIVVNVLTERDCRVNDGHSSSPMSAVIPQVRTRLVRQ
jgi:hypothetical protein